MNEVSFQKKTYPKIAELSKINKIYGHGELETEALKEISFDLYTGEFVILFGPSGSGKSTLLNIVAGLDEPTKGTVKIDKTDISTLSSNEKAVFHREKVGMVFQSYNLIPTLNLIQNIALPLVFGGVPKKEREERALKLLEEFGLQDLAYRLPSEISGGQQQRIGILRALINNSPLVIADEPTGNLDSKTSETVMSIFSVLCRSLGVTMCIVTHDSSQFHWADRVIHVLDGEIVKQSIFNDKPYYKDLEGNIEYRLDEGSLAMQLPDEQKVEATEEEAVDEPNSIEEESALDMLVARRSSYDADTERIIGILPLLLENYQSAHLNLDELLYIVQGVKKRIQNVFSHGDFEAYLRISKTDKGLGMYKQSAKRISNKLDEIIHAFGFIQVKQGNAHERSVREATAFSKLLLSRSKMSELDEKILVLLDFWLTKYQEDHLLEGQVLAIVSGFRHRLKGDFSKNDLFEYLNLSKNKGGAGLYKQTAKRLCDELEETILVFKGLTI